MLEPVEEIRELFVRLLDRLGHAAAAPSGRPEDNGFHADAVLVEPSDPESFEYASALRRLHADLPILCASIEPKDARVSDLAPAAYLVKPIALAQLDRALTDALG